MGHLGWWAKLKQLFSTIDSIFEHFTTAEAAKVLSIGKTEVAKLLYRYKKQGHLLMIKRGLYMPLYHKGLTPEETFVDPWSIVPAMFPDGYVGGWTAANYFGLTEQLFQVTCIITKTRMYRRSVKVGRFEYAIFNNCMSEDLGQDVVWREQAKIPVSDIHRTVIDMLENPECGAGIQNAIDCFKVYLEELYSRLGLDSLSQALSRINNDY